jgi:outer membrane lipoprotein-sorting protein
MRYFSTVLVLSVVGLVAHGQTAPLLPYKSARWKQTVTISGGTPEMNQSIRADLWYLSPDKLRVVTVVDGKRQVIVIGSGAALVHEEGSPVGLRIPLQKQMLDRLAQFTEVFSKIDTWKKSKAGVEEVGGRTCEVYAFRDTTDGQPVEGKVWIWGEKNFPLRIVQESQGRKVSVEHTDVEVNEGVSASLFAAPAGVKFMETPASAPGVAR